MEFFFGMVLLAISFATFSILHFLLRKQRKPKSIQEKVDPLTGHKRVRICEGEFERGKHDDLYMFGGALVTNAVFMESLVPLEKSLVTKALVSLAKIHPLLRMKCEWETAIHTGKSQRFLTEMQHFGPEHLLYSEENLDEGNWLQKFEDELQQGFDIGHGPLWRVVRLKESFDTCRNIYTNTLLFTFHHAISDEVSILNLFDQFLEIMDQIYCNEYSDENIQPLPLLPPLQDLVSRHTELPWWKVILLKLSTIIQSFRAPQIKFLELFSPPLRKNPEMAVKTCIIPGSLTESQTSMLLKICKHHKCTITGALGACMAIAVGKLVADVNASPTQFTLGIPVNTRKECRPIVNNNHFGLYIGIIFLPFAPSVRNIPLDNYFWVQAKEFSDGIKKELHANKQYGILSSLRYGCLNLVKAFEECKKDVQTVGRWDVFELTNGGNYDFDKNRVFKITGAHFGVSAGELGPLMTVSAVTTSGRLHWSVNYSNGAVHKEQACKFSDLFMESLIGIGCQDDN